MADHQVDLLTDRSVVLALQEITEATPSFDGADGIRSETDARAAVAQLLADAGIRAPGADDMLSSHEAALATARRFLELASNDPDLSSVAADIIHDPPRDEQMSLEAAIVGTVVLAAVISWLQTKISLRVRREGGNTEFEFRMGKQAASPELLRTLAETVSTLLGGGPGPPPPA